MIGFIIGEKSETSQRFSEDGTRIPVSFIKTAPCHLVSITWNDSSSYTSFQLGYGKTKKIAKPQQGHLKKAGIKDPLHFLRELRLKKYAEIKPIDENGKKGIVLGELKLFVGDELKPSIVFKAGEMVDVTGRSKGKGFQGVVVRHGFLGTSRTHGQSHGERAPGSIGSTTTPGRVFKGQKMAGKMGNDRITVKRLKIIETTDEGMWVKGLIPGSKKGLIEVKSSNLETK